MCYIALNYTSGLIHGWHKRDSSALICWGKLIITSCSYFFPEGPHTRISEPVSECAFGTAGFDTTKSSTYTPDPNKNFNISYGDGEFLTGVVGFDTVTVGGLTVKKQEIGLVTNAAWEGNDETSTSIVVDFHSD